MYRCTAIYRPVRSSGRIQAPPQVELVEDRQAGALTSHDELNDRDGETNEVATEA